MPHLLKGLSSLAGGNKNCFHPYEITENYLAFWFLVDSFIPSGKNFFHVFLDLYSDKILRGPLCISPELSFYATLPSLVLLPGNASHLVSLNSDLCSILRHGQPLFECSLPVLQPRNSIQPASWGNCKAHFVSLLSMITILHCLLSNVWKLLLYVLLSFSSSLSQKVK